MNSSRAPNGTEKRSIPLETAFNNPAMICLAMPLTMTSPTKHFRQIIWLFKHHSKWTTRYRHRLKVNRIDLTIAHMFSTTSSVASHSSHGYSQNEPFHQSLECIRVICIHTMRLEKPVDSHFARISNWLFGFVVRWARTEMRLSKTGYFRWARLNRKRKIAMTVLNLWMRKSLSRLLRLARSSSFSNFERFHWILT